METTYVYSDKIDNQQIVSNCLHWHSCAPEECVSVKVATFLDDIMSQIELTTPVSGMVCLLFWVKTDDWFLAWTQKYFLEQILLEKFPIFLVAMKKINNQVKMQPFLATLPGVKHQNSLSELSKITTLLCHFHPKGWWYWADFRQK